MTIHLHKFGQSLISRPAGKEALLAFRPVLREVPEGENIEIDFEGVKVLTPSWADEFLVPLMKEYAGRISLKKSDNSTVRATLEILNLTY